VKTEPRARRLQASGANDAIGRGRLPTSTLLVSMAALLPVVGLLSTSTPARAYSLKGFYWQSGHYSYRVNVNSFANNLKGLSLSQAQTEFWVPHAVSMWNDRTGARLASSYAGTTTNMPTCTSGNSNGTNEIVARSGCREAACSTLGYTQSWFTPQPFGFDILNESDICVYGNAPPIAWRVQAADFPTSGSADLIGLLVHEVGHALGLDHTPNTVMSASSMGGILNRYPYGDDINGIRAIYTTEPGWKRRWKKADPSTGTWNGPWTIPGATNMHALGAVRYTGSGYDTVVTRLANNGNSINFTRQLGAVATGESNWVNHSYSQGAWRPPSVAANTSNLAAQWLAAWAPKQLDATVCPGLRVGTSTNAFGTMSTSILGPLCGTLHEPTVTFDPVSGWFVLFYVNRTHPSGDKTMNGRIFARAWKPGASWTNTQDIGIYANDAVDIACRDQAPSLCNMTYARASANDPWVVRREFSVNSTTGALTVSSSFSENQNRTLATPAAAARKNIFGTVEWWFGLAFPATPTNTSNGLATAYTSGPSWAWTFVDDAVEHRAALAAAPQFNALFMFYTKVQ
jgi:hypothetical protein